MQSVNALEGRPARPPAMPKAVWAISAAILDAVVGQVVIAVTIGLAMVAVVSLDLERGAGTAVYLMAIGVLVVVHAALIHAAVRLISRSAQLPWVIWPAMLVLPAATIAVSFFSGGAIEAFPGQVSALSVALAFVSLRLWPGAYGSSASAPSNDPVR